MDEHSPTRRRYRPSALLAAFVVAAATLAPAQAARAADAELGVESVADWSGTRFSGGDRYDPVPAVATPDAHSGESALRVAVDATVVSESGWESVSRSVAGTAVDSLSFWVKSEGIDRIAVQLVDSTGQTHQSMLPLETTTDWQQVTLESPTAHPSHGSWGGAADGVWHGPASRLGFVVNAFARVDQTNPTASVIIDDIVAHTAAAALQLGQSALGNVFVDGEQVLFPYETSADILHWRVSDAHGTTVTSGEHRVDADTGELAIDGLPLGWYRLDIEAVTGDTTAATAATTFARLAEPLPASESSQGRFGAATHYGQSWSTDSLPLLATGGFAQLRDEVFWAEVEREPGVYDWGTARRDYLDRAEEYGVAPLLLAGYGNPLYDGGNGPKSPEAVQAYADYAADMAREFGDVAAGIELWNEWDIGLGGNTNTSAEDYVNLLEVASPAVKAAAPDVPVIGPAVAMLNSGWLERTFQLGALDHLDGIVLHAYSYPVGAEALDETLRSVDALVRRYNGGESKPLWITEHGWPTGTNARAVSERTQAANLAKSALIATANDAERYFVYDFVSDGTDPANSEHNFGLLHHPDDALGAFTPKPGYVAYSTAAAQLAGRTFTDRDESVPDVWNLGFTGDDGALRALWATTPQVVTLQARGEVTVTDVYGASRAVDAGDGATLTLDLGEAPIYVAGDVAEAVASATALALDPAFVGQPVTAHWTMDNGTGSTARTFRLEFTDGTVATQTVPAGEQATASFTLPAPTATGAYAAEAALTADGVYSGTLRAETTVSEPIGLSGRHAITADGVSVLRLRVTNAGGEPATIESLQYGLGEAGGILAEGEGVGGASEFVVDVPLDTLTAPTEWTARAVVDGRELTASGTVHPLDVTTSTPVAHRTIEVDGQLDDLEGVPLIDLATQGTDETVGSTGAADLSGTVWYTWDDDNLYLSADIADDVHDQPSAGSMIWQGDSIQFTAGVGAPGEATAWNELGVALTEDGPQLYRWLSVGDAPGPVAGASVAISRDDEAGRTVYEVAVPWNRLGGIDPADALLSGALLVNEADGQGRAGYLGWGGGIATEKDSAQFNALRLLPAAVVPDPDPTEPDEAAPGTGSTAGPAASALASTGVALTGAAASALLLFALGAALLARRRRADA